MTASQYPDRFHGRRRGRSLTAEQKKLLQELLPRILLTSQEESIDLKNIFRTKDNHPFKNYALEIGFGSGEHLAEQASLNLDVGFLGVEVFVNGVASFLQKVEEKGLHNVRVYSDDVRKILKSFKPQTFEKIFILFPDPWPKARHHKRRLISSSFVDSIEKILTSQGILKFASDDENYVKEVLHIFSLQSSFEPSFKTLDECIQRPPSWSLTRYEQKALQKGKTCYYLSYRKKN
jgi:tRNA (guanine-N7-)-methyltransferase